MDWDEDGWHYSADASAFGPLTAQYIFVLDALNFCFWPADGCAPAYASDRTFAQQTCLTPAAPAMNTTHWPSGSSGHSRPTPALLTPTAWPAWTKPPLSSGWAAAASVSWTSGPPSCARCDLAQQRPLRASPHTLPRPQLGHALEASFDGLAFNLLRAARGSAAELVRLITAHFPGFRDIAVHRGRQVFLYKRAQILAADVWAAYGRRTRDGPPPPGPCSPEDAVAFHDIAALTMFGARQPPLQ